MKRRLFSLLLTGAMLLSMCPPGLALEAEAGGLCPHHQEHSFEVCGYMEAIEGLPCGHVHGGDCGFVEAVPEVLCDMDCNETGEDGRIIHAEGCAYALEVEGTPCQHEHDGECGYVPADPGQPCGYVCPVCPVQAGNDLPMLAAAGDVEYLYCNANGQNWQTGTKASGDYTAVTASDNTWGMENTTTWYVASGDVTIGTEGTPQRIEIDGNVHLILEDGCNLTVNGGIHVKSQSSLCIYGQSETEQLGKLIAEGSDRTTGIGGNNFESSGEITIYGGNIRALGRLYAAGIGGAQDGGIKLVKIHGGVIQATGGSGNTQASGIGQGVGSNYCGDGVIMITGGTITAMGCGGKPGIGDSNAPQSTAKIEITGGTVTAIGQDNGAYGKGNGIASQGKLEITGDAVVYATAGSETAIRSENKANTENWNGIVFEKSNGTVYGNVTLTENLTIDNNQRLNILGDSTLTIDNVELTNNGTITNNGTLTNNGVLTNNGTIKGDGSYSGTGTVKKASQTTPGTGEGYTINYSDETIIPKDGYEVSSSNSGMESITGPIPGSMFYVRKAENNFYKASEWAPFTVADRPAAPTGLQGQNTSFAGESDGKITGLDSSKNYQISSDGGTSWRDAALTGTEITSLAAGSYQVRVKAVENSTFASASAVVTVGSGAQRTYTVTVNSGTGSGTYVEGAAVTITATVPGGQRFTSWTVNEGGVTLADASSATTTFIMPAQAVTVTANFENIPAPTYLVTVNGGTGGGEYAEGDTVTITATIPSGQRFTGWTVNEGGVTLADASSATTTFTMPAQAVTVTANFENIPAPTYLVTINGGTGGGEYAEGATVTITATVPDGQRFTGWTVNEGGMTLADASSATTTFTMPAQAVTVTANFQNNSSGGNSGSSGGGGSYTPPTYPPTVERPSEGGGAAEVFPSNPKPGDPVTVTPKPDDGYEVDEIIVTDKDGNPVEVTINPDGTYTFQQPKGKVTIEVRYRAVQPIEAPWNNPFSDVSEADWYYEAVRFVHERGLMNGYSDGRFGPNDPLSRAQLAQILFNKEGRPGVNYLLDFSDVADEAWYTEAIRWAASQGIVGGYGNGTFGPDDPITREQLAVMLWRHSGSPAATSKELYFNDTDEISGYALEALRWAVENGILNGYGNGRLGPQGQATRAQAAQMLKNFIENQEKDA